MAWVREKNPKPKSKPGPTRDPTDTLCDVLRYFSGAPNSSKFGKVDDPYDPRTQFQSRSTPKKRVPVVEFDDEDEEEDDEDEESEDSRSYHRERRYSHHKNHTSRHQRAPSPELSRHRYQPAGETSARPRYQPPKSNNRYYTAPLRNYASSSGKRNVSTTWASAATPLAL